MGFTTVQHGFSHSGQLLKTSADPTNFPRSSGGRLIAPRLIRPAVIDTGASNRQSPQLVYGQLRELYPRRRCQWCFLLDIEVLTEHKRQPLWVQELTTANYVLKWQEVCKSIPRCAGSGQVALQRHFFLVPWPSPDQSAKLGHKVSEKTTNFLKILLVTFGQEG